MKTTRLDAILQKIVPENTYYLKIYTAASLLLVCFATGVAWFFGYMLYADDTQPSNALSIALAFIIYFFSVMTVKNIYYLWKYPSWVPIKDLDNEGKVTETIHKPENVRIRLKNVMQTYYNTMIVIYIVVTANLIYLTYYHEKIQYIVMLGIMTLFANIYVFVGQKASGNNVLKKMFREGSEE